MERLRSHGLRHQLSPLGDGPSDGIQKGLIIDGFLEESHSPQFPRLFPDLGLITGGDDNHRNPYPLFGRI